MSWIFFFDRLSIDEDVEVMRFVVDVRTSPFAAATADGAVTRKPSGLGLAIIELIAIRLAVSSSMLDELASVPFEDGEYFKPVGAYFIVDELYEPIFTYLTFDLKNFQHIV